LAVITVVPSAVMAMALLDLLMCLPGAFPTALKVAGLPLRMNTKTTSSDIVPNSRTKRTTANSLLDSLLQQYTTE
jgi:hypothetical protein